eukprot:scaffold70717_cov42-Cyclotella_meneghiniana.AAC.2
MTGMWRKQLSKDADVIFTVELGPTFWGADMHEPLLIFIMLPLTYVRNYLGPWLLKGTDAAEDIGKRLTSGFKVWKEVSYEPRRFSELDGGLPQLWENPEEWSRTLLFEFLNKQREFPPVRQCLVRKLLHQLPDRPLPTTRFARGGGGDRVRPNGGRRLSAG